MKMVYVMGPRTRGPAAPPKGAAPGRLSRVPGRAPVAVPAAPVAEPPAALDPGAGNGDGPEVAAPETVVPETGAPEETAPETAAPAAAEPDAPPPAVTFLTPAPLVLPAGPPPAALPADPIDSVARAAADAFQPVVEQQAAWAERRSELEQTYRRLQRQVQAQLSGLRVQLATRLRSRP